MHWKTEGHGIFKKRIRRFALFTLAREWIISIYQCQVEEEFSRMVLLM